MCRLSNDVSLVCGGGANSIGGSFYVLKAGNTSIGIDYGGQLDPSLGFEPDFTVTDTLDHLFVTHAHFDHVGAVPLVRKRFPGAKIYATSETAKLAQVIWDQTLLHAEQGKAPFTPEDASGTLGAIRPIRVREAVELGPDLRVFPIYAAHILGAVSYLIEYRGKFYFFTGDVCYEDRSLLAGATRLKAKQTAALVRESTYIISSKDREAEKEKIITRVPELIGDGFQILIAALSIDRAQDVFCILAPIADELGIPIYIDGSKRVFKIYQENLKDGEALKKARWFDGNGERNIFLEDHEPGIVIASSGMMMPNTLSAKWAGELLPDPKAAIFTVNYQDPSTPGFRVRNSALGDVLALEDRMIKRQCLVEHFDLSAHMDMGDGEELEERMNPETIVYVHGEDAGIDAYLDGHRDSRRRIKSQTGKEVPLG